MIAFDNYRGYPKLLRILLSLDITKPSSTARYECNFHDHHWELLWAAMAG